MTILRSYCFLRVIFPVLLAGVGFENVHAGTTGSTGLSTSPAIPNQASQNGFTGRAYGVGTDAPPFGNYSNLPAMDAIVSDSTHYVPCPGDPSSVGYSGGPSYPICPDINGNITPDPSYPYYTTATQNNFTYYYPQNFMDFYAPRTNWIFTTMSKVYCPDYCVTSRYSSPAPVKPVSGLQVVSYFQNASCPDGYVEVASFNTQPAIIYFVAPQTMFGPFATVEDLDAYRYNPAFTCSITYANYSTTIAINSVMPSGAPYYNTASVDTSGIIADGVSKACSNDTPQNCYIGTDPGYPGGATPDVDMIINGYVGQWISQWTWSDFWNNQYGSNNACSILDGRYYSYATWDGSCQTRSINSATWHRDSFYHYYRYYRCKYTNSTGYYYTSSSVPISRVCARIKPQWQKTY